MYVLGSKGGSGEVRSLFNDGEYVGKVAQTSQVPRGTYPGSWQAPLLLPSPNWSAEL